MGRMMMEFMKGAEAREAAMAALLRDAEMRSAAQTATMNEMLALQHQQTAAALKEAEAAKALLAEYMGSETRGTAAVHATFFTPAWDVTAEIGQDPSAAEGDEEKAVIDGMRAWGR